MSNHNKDAQDKSASKEMKKKATRGSLASGRAHSSLDRWRESRGVGRGGWCGELRCQKRVGSGLSKKKNDDDGIKRGSREAQTKVYRW